MDDPSAQLALDHVVNLLTIAERTPFGAHPNFPTSAPDSPQLSSIEKKVYAIAVRAFTAENTIIGQRDKPSQHVVAPSVPQAAQDASLGSLHLKKVDQRLSDLKTTVQELTDLVKGISRTTSVRSIADTNSSAQIVTKLDALYDQAVHVSGKERDNVTRELASLRNDMKSVTQDVRQHVYSFERACHSLTKSLKDDDPNRKPDDQELPPQPATTVDVVPEADKEIKLEEEDAGENTQGAVELSTEESGLGSTTVVDPLTATPESEGETALLKSQIEKATSIMKRAAVEAELPWQDLAYNADDATEIHDLKRALGQLFSVLKNAKTYVKREIGEDAPSPAVTEPATPDNKDAALWSTQVKAVSDVLRDITLEGVLPPMMPDDPDDLPYIATVKISVNTLIKNLGGLSKYFKASDTSCTCGPCLRTGSTDEERLATPEHCTALLTKATSQLASSPNPFIGNVLGIWKDLQKGLLDVARGYKWQLKAIDHVLEQFVAGNFDFFAESTGEPRSPAHRLSDKLRTYKEQQLQLCSEMADGKLNATIPDPDQGDGAWTELRVSLCDMNKKASPALTHSKLPQHLSMISQAVSDAAKGEFERARVPEAARYQTTGALNKLVTWVDLLISNLQAFHKDVDTIAKGMIAGKVPILLPEKHIGEWKQARLEINKMTRVLSNRQVSTIIRYTPTAKSPTVTTVSSADSWV